MRTVFSLLVLAGIAAGGTVYYKKYYAVETPKVYRTVPIERGELTSTISATGTLEPEDLIDIGAQVTGKILSFGDDPSHPGKTVDYRSKVRKGMLLATIDDTYYKAEMDQSRAALLKAEAEVLQLQATCEQTKQEWARAQVLRPQKAIADTDYDTAKANYEVAKANLEVGKASVAQARAAMEVAKTNLNYTKIVSPVDGEVVARRVNVGQTVTSGLNTPSIVLIAKDLRRLQIWASVNEADIGRIHLGMPVRFTVNTFPGESFHGDVTQIRLNAQMTQNVVFYTVVVTVDNASMRLYPYMTTTVYFEVEHRKNAFKVPNAVFRWKPSSVSLIVPSARDFSSAEESKTETAAAEADSPKNAKATSQRERHRLWVPDGKYVRPLDVFVGITDETMTEIHGEGVREGLKIVVGEGATGEVDESDASTTNPFLPKMPKGHKPPPPPG